MIWFIGIGVGLNILLLVLAFVDESGYQRAIKRYMFEKPLLPFEVTFKNGNITLVRLDALFDVTYMFRKKVQKATDFSKVPVKGEKNLTGKISLQSYSGSSDNPKNFSFEVVID